MIDLILLSGGKGLRMNSTVPKQYMELRKIPIIIRCLYTIDKISEIGNVIIVCSEEYIDYIEELIGKFGIKKPIVYAPAGNTRQESVKSGLGYVTTDEVIIHEAVRPFAGENEYQRIIYSQSKNAMLGIPVPFTVFRGNETIVGLLTRNELINGQSPQKFDTNMLIRAHQKAADENKEFTDDASLFYYYFPEETLTVIQGKEYNIKITTKLDILLGEVIIDNNNIMLEK